jgi:ribonuclease P protein component
VVVRYRRSVPRLWTDARVALPAQGEPDLCGSRRRLSVDRSSQMTDLQTLMEPDREQADLPAEQPPACQDARLPPAHAYACRPRDHRRSPAQGPQRTVGLGSLAVGFVLPRANRMRRSGDFTSVVRAGARSRRGCLVAHLQPSLTAGPPLVGLIIGRSVGGSVVRHRVARRLRAQLATRVPALPSGSGLVIRALPSAATATSERIGAELDSALSRVLAGAPR